jgi:cell division protein FtsA
MYSFKMQDKKVNIFQLIFNQLHIYDIIKMCFKGEIFMNKKIFAALEIADQEIRIIVGEFYNSRFNVIRVDKYRTAYKVGNRIVDETKLSLDVKAAVLRTSKNIQAPISAILLLIPSINMKKIPLRVNVDIKDGIITKSDIRKAFDKANKVSLEDNYIVIDSICNKYLVGNTSFRRPPIGKKANLVSCSIDLLCVKQSLAFKYVKVIEGANLRVIDIVLDIYGIAEEACLFDKSEKKNIIVLQINANSTRLGLISDCRIVTTESINSGINRFINIIKDTYNLSYDVSKRLVLYNNHLMKENLSDDPVYIWDYKSVTHQLSENEILSKIKPSFNDFAVELAEACKPIIDSKNTEIVITGMGAEFADFNKYLEKLVNVEVTNYIPETLGARYGQYTGLLGTFYVYRDKSRILDESDISVDLDIFNEKLDESKKDKKNLSMTNKLRKIIMNTSKEEK